MAKQVFKNAMILLNAQDISNYCDEVTIETTRDEVEVTGFQAANKEILAGLGDATITLSVFQDFSAAAIDALLWPLSTSNTPFTVEVRPTNAARSVTNPAYVMSCLLFTYNPIAGKVGDALQTPVTLRNATQAGLTKATS